MFSDILGYSHSRFANALTTTGDMKTFMMSRYTALEKETRK
jgi:hypothetical protein